MADDTLKSVKQHLDSIEAMRVAYSNLTLTKIDTSAFEQLRMSDYFSALQEAVKIPHAFVKQHQEIAEAFAEKQRDIQRISNTFAEKQRDIQRISDAFAERQREISKIPDAFAEQAQEMEKIRKSFEASLRMPTFTKEMEALFHVPKYCEELRDSLKVPDFVSIIQNDMARAVESIRLSDAAAFESFRQLQQSSKISESFSSFAKSLRSFHENVSRLNVGKEFEILLSGVRDVTDEYSLTDELPVVVKPTAADIEQVKVTLARFEQLLKTNANGIELLIAEMKKANSRIRHLLLVLLFPIVTSMIGTMLCPSYRLFPDALPEPRPVVQRMEINVRRNPKHGSLVDYKFIAGAPYSILQSKDRWTKIQFELDGLECKGWVRTSRLEEAADNADDDD